MSEEFLIVSVVKWISDEFERLSEDYAKGKRRLRTDLELVEKVADDQNEREVFIARMNEAQKTRATMEGDPVTEADLLVIIERIRRMATPSLVDQRTRRMVLDVWREETSDPIADDNIERSRIKRFLDH
ncbi:MAG: hypothetical protein ABJB49_10400 [Nitrospirota bacterium]